MTLQLINTRRNNKIYTDQNFIYKIFNQGYDKRLVFLESFITAEVESVGVNVPSILEVSLLDDKWSFKTEFIKGKTLFDMINESPEKTDEYLDKMVKIHTSIHKLKCPKLPIQKQKLTDYIQTADLSKDLKVDLIDMLNASPKHKKLVHGNLTPHNIIVSENRDYIVDWNHGAQGSASADVAYTYIWMQMNMPQYAETYLKKFCDATHTTSKYVHNWIPIVAAAKLNNSNADEKKSIKKFNLCNGILNYI